MAFIGLPSDGILTACNVMETENKFPQKLKVSPLSTREQVEAMKKEIRDKIATLRGKLNSLECDLLAEVDTLGALQESERKELQDNIDSMRTVKASLLATKCSKEVKSFLAVAVKDLDNKINRYSQELLQYQKIKSTWRTSYWDECTFGPRNSGELRNLCTLANVRIMGSIYQSKQIPNWQISGGSGPSQLRSPVSLAIQDFTNDIYVSDLNGMRIQVFSSEGEHKTLLDKFNSGPLQVFSVCETDLHAYNRKENAIYEFFVHSIDEYQVKYSYNTTLKKVIVSNLGEYYSITSHNNKHTVIELNELKNESLSAQPSLGQLQPQPNMSQLAFRQLQPQVSASKNVSLRKGKSSSLKFTPVDIAHYQKSIFLLSSQGGDLIYEYNLNCVFVRSFFPCPTMTRPRAMCIDRKGNIIVTGDNVEPVELPKVSASQPVPMFPAPQPVPLFPAPQPVPMFPAPQLVPIHRTPEPVADSDSDSDPKPPPISQSAITKLFVISQKGDVIIHEMDILCENCIGVAVSSEFDIFLLNNDKSFVLSSL